MLKEVKGTLARLLATENLIVEHKQCGTASFDVDTRVLTLPIWEYASDRVYTMLVGHEVGHALFTPKEEWRDAGIPKSYLNITEDARIEKLMKRKFPGLSKDFYQGYSELNEQDFFRIRDMDINKMNLIDRINLYFKIGAYQLINFTPAETALRDAVGAAETFQDAIDAALAIYKFAKEQQESKKTPMNIPESENGNQQTDKIEGDEEMTHEEMLEESEKREQENKDPADLDTPSYNGGGEDWDEDELDSITDEALSDNIEKLASKFRSEIKYISVPDIKLDEHVVSPHTINDMSEEYWARECFHNEKSELFQGYNDWTYNDGKFSEFKKSCQREVNYLSKEFEARKAATAYQRQTTARTGVLDTKKLHSYKYNDDLFKKVTIRPDGKNHGLIFLLDWSGSMAPYIHETYKQLLSLCFFCRRSGIPFEVYGFVNDATFCGPDIDWNKTEEYHGPDNTFKIPRHFFLLNFLSSTLNNATFDKYARNLWRVTYTYSCRQMPGNNWQEYTKINVCNPPHLGLSGTPLNEAIVCLQSVIPDFKTRTGAEKVNTLILTDGEAQWSACWTYLEYRGEKIAHTTQFEGNYLRCSKTGRTYKPAQYDTEQILNYMKGRFPEVNFLGFRIGSTADINRVFYYSMQDSDAAKKHFAKYKNYSAKILGYEEIYFIKADTLDKEAEFEVDEEATKVQIKNAFKKSLTTKANNKRILSSFIGQIA